MVDEQLTKNLHCSLPWIHISARLFTSFQPGMWLAAELWHHLIELVLTNYSSKTTLRFYIFTIG